jgi:hypothetical protein
MEKSRLKNTNRNNMENYNLNREMDLVNSGGISNDKILGDRDIFNKFSNENEQLDMTMVKHDEYNYGMPIFNGQILNNKKSLITSPFIVENNNKNNFVSNHLSLDSNDMYAEIENKNDNKFDSDVFTSMAYNNNKNFGSTLKKPEEHNLICKIERDITEYEYELNLKKSRELLMDVNSPFALGYIWKSIILLSKNPTTDKLLNLLGVKNKDMLINDIKYNSEVFTDSGNLEIVIPRSNQVINTNFISKIETLYGITIRVEDTDNENSVVNMSYKFNLDIPFYYQPKIVFGYLQNFTKSKIKFMEMTNVPVSLMIYHNENVVVLEIPMGFNMVLGFVYDTNRQNVRKLPYRLMLENKVPEVLVKKLVVPKITRNKRSLYSKKFKEELSSVHLGEITYGMMSSMDINVDMGLNIEVTNEVSKDKYEIKRNIDYININHKCFYYIKNSNIENKLLITGIINY